jgi:arylsulfatase A-like enzyme
MNMPKKNIILFLTDQQHFRTLRENGCPEALTPNIDRLAREGINFQNHYVANPVCSPSRGAIWTGRFPSENGLYGNGCTLPETETTLPMILNEHGYTTGHFGKLHLEPAMTHGTTHRSFGFDTCRIAEGDQYLTHDDYNLWLRQTDPKAFFDYYHQMAEQGHGKAYTANLPEHLSMNAWVTAESIQWMHQQASGNQPFFLSMGYFDPHHAWNPCEPYASEFAYRAVSPPKTDPADIPKKPSLWGGKAQPFDPFDIGSIIRSYHAMIAHIDACLGRLLGALESAGLLQDTVIVFSSDHGEFLGNHDRLFKGPFLCDDLLRVPMIIWDGAARNTLKGKTDLLTSSLDLFPTFQALAGIQEPLSPHGTRMVDTNLNIAPDGEREEAISEWRSHPGSGEPTDDILSIRTKEDRYVTYAVSDEEEYYRHSEDPFELDNRAADPATADRRRELAGRLRQHAPQRGDWPAPTAPW